MNKHIQSRRDKIRLLKGINDGNVSISELKQKKWLVWSQVREYGKLLEDNYLFKCEELNVQMAHKSIDNYINNLEISKMFNVISILITYDRLTEF